MRLTLLIAAMTIAVLVAMDSSRVPVGSAARIPTLFVSPTGNDAGRCTNAAPCRSLGRAYRVAELGSIVQVAGGSYGAQTIGDDSSKDADRDLDVTFRPAPRSKSSFAGLTVSARHIVFAGTGLRSGFSFGAWMTMPGASDITFRDVSTNIFGIVGATKISIIGGQVGPWDSSPAGEDPQIKAASPTTSPPTDILISGVYFHDITKNSYPDYHTDCLQFLSGKHVVIRGNTFARCSDTDLFVRSWARGPADALSDFVVEHNLFGATSVNPGYYDLQLADSQAPGFYCDSFVFRLNTVVGRGIVFDCAPPKGTRGAGILYANVLPTVGAWTCGQNSATGNQPSYSYNVYTDSRSAVCSRTESVARPLIVLKDGAAVLKAGRVQLTYTVVAPGGVPVKVTASRRGRNLWSARATTPATPHARAVILPRDVSAAATRLCVSVGNPPLQRSACAATPRSAH